MDGLILLLDLGAVPLLAVCLGITAAALAAKTRFYWYDAERTFFTKLSFSVMAAALVVSIGLCCWYLMHRFVAAFLSIM